MVEVVSVEWMVTTERHYYGVHLYKSVYDYVAH